MKSTCPTGRSGGACAAAALSRVEPARHDVGAPAYGDSMHSTIALRPWTNADLGIIKASNAPEMIYAFPRIDNAPSNRICEKAGMTNTGPEPFEYPKGVPITCNAWVFDLLPVG